MLPRSFTVALGRACWLCCSWQPQTASELSTDPSQWRNPCLWATLVAKYTECGCLIGHCRKVNNCEFQFSHQNAQGQFSQFRSTDTGMNPFTYKQTPIDTVSILKEWTHELRISLFLRYFDTVVCTISKWAPLTLTCSLILLLAIALVVYRFLSIAMCFFYWCFYISNRLVGLFFESMVRL